MSTSSGTTVALTIDELASAMTDPSRSKELYASGNVRVRLASPPLQFGKVCNTEIALSTAMILGLLAVFGVRATHLLILLSIGCALATCAYTVRHFLPPVFIFCRATVEYRKLPVLRGRRHNLEDIPEIVLAGSTVGEFLPSGIACASEDTPQIFLISKTQSNLNFGQGASARSLRQLALYIIQRRLPSETVLSDLYEEWGSRLNPLPLADLRTQRLVRQNVQQIIRSLWESVMALITLILFAYMAHIATRNVLVFSHFRTAILSLAFILGLLVVIRIVHHLIVASAEWILEHDHAEARVYRNGKLLSRFPLHSVEYVIPSMATEGIYAVHIYLSSGARINIRTCDEMATLHAAAFIHKMTLCHNGIQIVGHLGAPGGNVPPAHE